jgi:hypothetical protein
MISWCELWMLDVVERLGSTCYLYVFGHFELPATTIGRRSTSTARVVRPLIPTRVNCQQYQY